MGVLSIGTIDPPVAAFVVEEFLHLLDACRSAFAS